MASATEAVSQSVRELGEHAKTAFTDTKLMPYYIMAGGAMAASLGLFISKRRELALFVGMWPTSIIAMAILGRISRSPTQEILH
ncbi:MAG: hypothetical protein ACREQX_17570 [Candidatus Binataceae bacterium]